MKTGIFFGSTTGNTEEAAMKIKELLGGAELYEISSTSIDDILKFDNIIFGCSTWGYGELQQDWDDKINEFKGMDLSGKKITFFGTGDQQGYSETFIDALGIIYEALENSNAEFIGSWPTDGYSFDNSKAIKNGDFIGLALDYDCQPELNDKRIGEWVSQLKNEFN